jgi:hypothetical protein
MNIGVMIAVANVIHGRMRVTSGATKLPCAFRVEVDGQANAKNVD